MTANEVSLGRELRSEEWEKIEENRRQEVGEIAVSAKAPVIDSYSVSPQKQNEQKKSKFAAFAAPPSTGGRAEPNDQPYGDVFFEHTGVNPFVDTEDDRLSTFGLDVDTGSFTIARQYLKEGHLPPRAAIRVEEFVNAFGYGDRPPRKGDFRLIVEGAPSAFADSARTYTLRLAVKAREVDDAARPPAVLVFCVDVSGSMDRENRLGLVKKTLFDLLENLRRDDHVGLVVYGSTGRVLLKPTTDHEAIRRAIDRLSAGGSTNAEEGLVLAYDLLSDGDADGRIRRVILCSDGVANVGRTGPDSILERIRREAGDGIELTTVGFGMGNYNDVLMERLADSGDGRYAYVDDLKEARRIFVEELTGTLLTLGHDAKAQVEFDPDVVSRWRLLGYENRDIADHLFRDPTVDAGEIGAGHTVTALYEVKLRPEVSRRGRVATLRLRYRPMGKDGEVELEKTLKVSELDRSWDDASPALRLASVVAEFAEILKGAYWAKDGDLDDLAGRVGDLRDGVFEGDARVADLEAMVTRAAELHGRQTGHAID
jgi:Ca-activated chloride channel family protein